MRWWLVLASLLLAVPAHAADDEALWQRLRSGGHVILMRHAITTPGVGDPAGFKLDDCSTQRNLDENGRAQATRIGEAFRAHRVTVGIVLASPRCRCMDTARLAFGRAEPMLALQGSLNNRELRRRQVDEITAVIARHRAVEPLVLVTHGSVVTDLTGLDVRMGEFVVLQRSPDGAHRVAGRLHVE